MTEFKNLPDPTNSVYVQHFARGGLGDNRRVPPDGIDGEDDNWMQSLGRTRHPNLQEWDSPVEASALGEVWLSIEVVDPNMVVDYKCPRCKRLYKDTFQSDRHQCKSCEAKEAATLKKYTRTKQAKKLPYQQLELFNAS